MAPLTDNENSIMKSKKNAADVKKSFGVIKIKK